MDSTKSTSTVFWIVASRQYITRLKNNWSVSSFEMKKNLCKYLHPWWRTSFYFIKLWLNSLPIVWKPLFKVKQLRSLKFKSILNMRMNFMFLYLKIIHLSNLFFKTMFLLLIKLENNASFRKCDKHRNIFKLTMWIILLLTGTRKEFFCLCVCLFHLLAVNTNLVNDTSFLK